MDYYIKKDLTEIVRAKKANNVMFAMREALAVPSLKKEGYLVEHASTTTSGLVTREFLDTFSFEQNYNPTDIATLDVTAIGTMITSFLAADVTRPTVVSTTPANNATRVKTNQKVDIQFSETVYPITGKKGAIYKLDGTTWTKVTDTASLTSSPIGGGKGIRVATSNFLNNTKYKIVLPADSVEDCSANGNNYNTAYSFEFTTVPVLELVSSVPADDATGVAVDANIVVTFSNELNTEASTFTLKKVSDNSTIAATVTYDATKKIVTVNPDAALTAETEYKLVCDAVDDVNQYFISFDITFTTAAE